MAEKSESRSKDMMIFVVSTIIMCVLLWCCPAWFWVPLPFVLTYLTKAFDAI
ncbi:MAG: hypothetical protein WAS56_15520 [Saprospiraceae bacterium]|nr:hypothetical protein [Saprospiraceae bacterium]MBK7468543.1 hypothetical protein [Saprospiraceae bacterium]MBK9993113.1 hypothetical protein [Saprospiraceae bacterium]HOJ91590.1 hypothetical protein [Saprospiraceae bacterium]HUN17790.1 hypothetical protein [Saprospiraceae bacterium]